jgi:hypothetical protein
MVAGPPIGGDRPGMLKANPLKDPLLLKGGEVAGLGLGLAWLGLGWPWVGGWLWYW